MEESLEVSIKETGIFESVYVKRIVLKPDTLNCYDQLYHETFASS